MRKRTISSYRPSLECGKRRRTPSSNLREGEILNEGLDSDPNNLSIENSGLDCFVREDGNTKAYPTGSVTTDHYGYGAWYYGLPGNGHIEHQTTLRTRVDEGASGFGILIGGHGDDNLVGRVNEGDIYIGGAGIASVAGSFGDDSLNGGPGSGHFQGDTGDDTLIGDDQHLVGWAGNDRLYGDTANKYLSGDFPHDDLYGGVGYGTFSCGADGEWNPLVGGSDDDAMDGIKDNDYMKVEESVDHLYVENCIDDIDSRDNGYRDEQNLDAESDPIQDDYYHGRYWEIVADYNRTYNNFTTPDSAGPRGQA